MHIQLYPKIHPKRLTQPVKDLKQAQQLLATKGEPLIVEAMYRQVSDGPIHVRRNTTFIGEFVSQIVLHDDVIVNFIDAKIIQPMKTRYTIILAEDFRGKVSFERSTVMVDIKSKDVALAGIGGSGEELTIEDSTIHGGIFYVKNVTLKGDVAFLSPSPADFACHILDAEMCNLHLKQNSIKHDVDMVPFDQIKIDGRCVLSGGFKIGELIIADTLKSLELLTFASHFKDPSMIRLGHVMYERGNKNITHIYLKNTTTRLLSTIDEGIRWRVDTSTIQMEDVTDGSTWSIEDDVVVQISDGARTSLRDLGIAQLVSTKEHNVRSNASSEASVFDNLDLSGLGMSEKVEKKATEKIREMIGQDLVKQQLEDFISQSEMDKLRVARGLSDGSTITRNMVFSGPPGVGKTEFARLVGQALYENGVLPENKLVEVSAARDLIAGYLGQTADKTHEVAASAYGGVLFVDEAYALANDSDGQFGAKAMEQLLKEADDHRDELVVILAGYEHDMRDMFENGNPGLKRRFPYWISFTNYNTDEFVEIFKLMLKHNKSLIEDGIIESRPFKELLTVYADSNSNAGGVRNLVEALILARDSRLRGIGAHVSNEELVTITAADLVTVYKRKQSDMEKEAAAKNRQTEESGQSC